MNRMNREQFFAELTPLTEEQLKKVLWNLYWRGTAAVRERIEAEVKPGASDRRKRAVADPPDADAVLEEVREFVSLARSGAYIGGDRRVSPGERTRWRHTFNRLVVDARNALLASDGAPGAAAVEAVIDLACESRDHDYFRSEDPVEAARIVVSDEVALLWGRLLEHSGFRAFADHAAPQLIRWESRFGWTRSGFGQVSQKETSLATVLASMLRVPDAWVTFADRYLKALDEVARRVDAARPSKPWQSMSGQREQRTAALAEWHLLLLERFGDDEEGDHLDRLAAHPALGGPELTFLQARLSHRRGDVTGARGLVHESLTVLPGHRGFLDFAAEIGAPVPPRAQARVHVSPRTDAARPAG